MSRGSCSAMIIIRGCVFSFGVVAWLPGGRFKHVFGMLIPIRGERTRTNKKWVALISATTKQLTIEIKSESETNMETDVVLGHQDVAMLLVGQLLCHRCHQFFLGEKEVVLMGIEWAPPSPMPPPHSKTSLKKINLLPQKEIKMSKSPNPSSLFRTNSLLVWGFEVRVDAILRLSDGMLSSYRSQVFWMRKKTTNRYYPWTPTTPGKMKVLHHRDMGEITPEKWRKTWVPMV